MHNDMTERGKLAVTINPGTTEVMHTSTATSFGRSLDEGYYGILLSTNLSLTFTFTSLLYQPLQVPSFVILCAYARGQGKFTENNGKTHQNKIFTAKLSKTP